MSLPSPGKAGVQRFRECFNFRLFYSCAMIALSQVNFGMDQGAFTNTQAMSAFTIKFGVYNEVKRKYELESYFLSLLNSLNYIGFAFGLVTGNLLSARIGRKKCFAVMAVWAIAGATICITSQSRWQMLAGRIVAYVYIGMELALVPILQSELVPAPVRGFVVGTYQSSLLLGSLIMALICRGTSTITGDNSWKIPLGLLYIVPVMLLCGIWYVPESPRWLLSENRPEEAWENLKLLREGKFTEEQIHKEFLEFQSTLTRTVEKGSLAELFQGRNLKRTMIVIGVNVCLHITGQNFASVYGTIFIRDIGVVDPFSMSSGNSAVSIVFVLLSQYLNDMTGRIPLLMTGAVIQFGALMTMGGLGTDANPSQSVKAGIVAMLTVFAAGFALGWAPLSHVVAAEIPTQRLRDKTYALGSIFNIAIQFAVSFSIPYLLNDAGLGSKIGFIFGSTAFLALVFTWFCVPECSGKTLEEIDQLFLENVPIRQFGKVSTRHHVEVFEEEESAGGKAVVIRTQHSNV